MADYPEPPFPKQHQPMPGKTGAMKPVPDHGEQTYKGSGRLAGNVRSSRAAIVASVAPWQLPLHAKAPMC